MVRVGQTWQEAGMTSPPEAGAHILHCGICDLEVHRYLPGQARSAWEQERLIMECEAACEAHLEEAHPRRYRLWRRLGSRTGRPWRWLVGGLAS